MPSATKAPGAEGPGDWVLVPREPTEAMERAFEAAFWAKSGDIYSPTPTERPEDGGGPFGYGYRSMLKAAPSNTTAPTPTDPVGEDVRQAPQKWHLVPASMIEQAHQHAVDLGQCSLFVDAKPLAKSMGDAASFLRQISHADAAPAPSDPAGAGGDLGELERLSAAAPAGEWHPDLYDAHDEDGGPTEVACDGIVTHDGEDDAAGQIASCGRRVAEYVCALVNAHRAGQPIAVRAARGSDARLRQAVNDYLAAFDADPEQDCWDTNSGEEEPGALKFSSDWAWADLREAQSKARAALRDAVERSGQLVASTPGQKGAGEEKTGAPPLGSGSRPSDQAASHPAPAGFDPSRVWRWIAIAPKDGTLVELRGTYADATDPDDMMWYTEGWYEASPADRCWYDAKTNEPCHPEEWRSLTRHASVSDEHPAGEDAIAAEGEACQRGGEAETPAQTPPSPPSATPEGDPPMTVEEDQIESLIAIWSMRPAPGCEAGQAWEAGARQGWKWAFAALRTLHAAGEVRHDQ